MVKPELDNPYAWVDWSRARHRHSVSHQHAARLDELERLWGMGIRHFPLSNYYPSVPCYPLPAEFLDTHPDALGAPNAEHHACTDHAGHWNALGSFYATGSRQAAARPNVESPGEYEFSDLHPYDPAREPWCGFYRLDLRLARLGSAEAVVALSLEGGVLVDPATGAVRENGTRTRRLIRGGSSFHVRAVSDRLRVRVDGDAPLDGLKLAQGVFRPWRDAFRAALDGTRTDGSGRPMEGLQYPDGGGITINHPPYVRGVSGDRVDPPYSRFESYIELLDFDARVLGIEIWNAHEGFGRKTGLDFYELWDDILRTGRRCLGFFVKDHFAARPGRNILLVPDTPGADRGTRERQALRAYRRGAFFGLVGAVATDDAGAPVPPYDASNFRFTKIAVVPGPGGRPEGVEAAVTGVDARVRPHVQIRFVTASGVAQVTDGEARAVFRFPRDAAGRIPCGFVRVEAFAYPDRLLDGTVLTPARVAAMSVRELAATHNHCDRSGPRPMPLSVVDMLFSQPIRVLPKSPSAC